MYLTVIQYYPAHVISLLTIPTTVTTNVLILAAIQGFIFIIIKMHSTHSPKARKPFIPTPASSFGIAPIEHTEETQRKQNILITTFFILRSTMYLSSRNHLPIRKQIIITARYQNTLPSNS